MQVARMPTASGSSKGQWMVRELPGVILVRPRSGTGWYIHIISLKDPLPQVTIDQLKAVWGDEFLPDLRVVRLHGLGHTMRAFKSRSDALSCLESHINRAPETVLGEVL